MKQPRGLEIWTGLSVIVVGSTVLALIATSKPAESGLIAGCVANTDCGCTLTEGDPGCETYPRARLL